MRLVFSIATGFLLASCANPKPPEPIPVDPVPVSKAALVKITKTYVQFDDIDPFEWTGIRPWRYPVHGIDVARFQGEIDWKAAGQSGVNFAFIKATEGGDHLDEKFQQNWKAARGAGVLRGAYHFYYFCRTAAEQANWFIENVPRDEKALPPVLDMEWNNASPTCRFRPSPAKVRSEMRIYLSRVTAHYGKPPVIYVTPKFYKENQLWQVRGYHFWLRTVAGHPTEIYPSRAWTFWQYSSTGQVPGIEGNVDINAFAGTIAKWKSWVVGEL